MTLLESLRARAGTKSGTRLAWLLLGAAAVILFWRIAGDVSMRLGPDTVLMENAAGVMRRAGSVMRDARMARAGTPVNDAEPDGSRFDVIHGRDELSGFDGAARAPAIASPRGKRTVAGPDTAALFSRQLRRAGLRAGDTVAVVLSDAWFGGNVAVLSAIESYGLRSRVVSSLNVSAAGTDSLVFTWLDAEAAVREAGVWRVHSMRALLAAESRSVGAGETGGAARAAMLAAVKRADVPRMAADDFAGAVRESAAVMDMGPDSAAKPALLIIAGSSRLALGDCLQPQDLPHGLVTRPLVCREGAPGLIQIALGQGIPVLVAFTTRTAAPAGTRSR